jgi:MATE family multidrug resistance protein
MALREMQKRWSEENGYRVVLKMAVPLILSTGAWAIQQFVDRVFLTWYSPESIAAALPSGITNLTLFSLFIGTASYVNTFVAQYFGANRSERIGLVVWQGIFLALPAIGLCLIVAPWVSDFFKLMGHDARVQEQEIIYFRVLLYGAPAVVITNAVSGVFSGIGKPWTIVLVDGTATLINIVLDYVLIFGKFGFPEMGIAGAGWATVIGMSVGAVMFLFLLLRPGIRIPYKIGKGFRFDEKLFRRLLFYGIPNGMQIFLEVSAFTLFIMIIGKVGVDELAATNVAFNINSLAFVPMLGMMTAISTLVGQRLGGDRPDAAERITWSAFHLCFGFFCVLSIGYFFWPGLFLLPYRLGQDPAQAQSMQVLLPPLLRFVAIYSLFDAMNMTFSAALKGAGDTRFVARTTIQLSWTLMVVPSIVGWYLFNCGLYWLWIFVTLYVTALGLTFFWRFRRGWWRDLRVIEEEPDV